MNRLLRVERLVVALDASVAVEPAALALAWDLDEEARTVGAASIESPAREDFLPEVLALVVIPLLVNVASNAASGIASRLVSRLRPAQPDQPELELVETTRSNGDRLLVVRLRGGHP